MFVSERNDGVSWKTKIGDASSLLTPSFIEVTPRKICIPRCCFQSGFVSSGKRVSTTSSVCAYRMPSESNIDLIESLGVSTIKKDVERYHNLQIELPILFAVLEELNVGVQTTYLVNLLAYLVLHAKSPFNKDHRVPVNQLV